MERLDGMRREVKSEVEWYIFKKKRSEVNRREITQRKVEPVAKGENEVKSSRVVMKNKSGERMEEDTKKLNE